MRSWSSVFTFLLLATSGTLLLCTPFATDSSLANSIITAKVCWFYYAMFAFSLSTFVSVVVTSNAPFIFTWADGLLVTFAGITATTYNWSLNPEPEKLFFGTQLLTFWFLLRYAFAIHPCLKYFFMVILLCTGLLEVFRGIEQLFGWSVSNHVFFKLTGTFFNPGPYTGYLAILLPISLDIMLGTESSISSKPCITKKAIHYFAGICFFSILVILPAGMSRSAWLAALVSCGWVYIIKKNVWSRIKKKKINKSVCFGITIAFLLTLSIGWSFYLIKRDSANGRFLIWKVTCKALAKHPIKGIGLGGFPAAYAQAQATYFASGNSSEIERRVAGCPKYAFNEYLHIALEQGLVGLVVFLSWIVICLYYGLKNKSHGICGGILALSVFAISSYPLQLPSFWIVLIFLSACTPPLACKKWKNVYVQIIMNCALIICLGICYTQKDKEIIYRQWGYIRMLYNNHAYRKAGTEYIKLYKTLKHQPEFIIEGAQCLRKINQSRQAAKWLQRATQLSSDPMFYYLQACSLQESEKFEEAEKILLYAIQILPERLYPYYLLVKLYAEPKFRQPEKMRSAALILLSKKPKIQNKAVQQMQEEAKKY